MINFNLLYQQIATSCLSHWLEILPSQIAVWQKNNLNIHSRQWQKSIKYLPCLNPQKLELSHCITAQQENTIGERQLEGIEKLLRYLMPWRKGPYSLYGINIDTEWQCNWKWQRILPHISPLINRTVLDVGCNNGYYMWRMIGAGARFAIGIDPTQLFLYQFEAIRKLLGNDRRLHVLPLGIEQLPRLQAFDTVFSMGVLYHCRSPLDHLIQLKNQLVSNGELILETIVIEGDENTVLVPKKSYAKMRNIYFIPSAIALKKWLEKCGLLDVRIVNCTITSLEEQHETKWMTKKSLSYFLDPKDIKKTIEGYPAPVRAVLIARKK